MTAKVSHSVANYGPGHKDGDHCAICKNFIPEASCKKVVSPVAPMGWCRFYEGKPK